MNAPWAIQESWLQEMYAIFIAHQSDKEIADLLQSRGIPLRQEEGEWAARDRSDRGVYRRGSTAVIPIEGPIFPKANLMTMFCGATSLETVVSDFQAAEDDDAVKNIIFPSNSPGGVVTGIDEFGQMLVNSKKPVYGHVSGQGASAMYWLLTQMSHLSLSPTSSVGSIGVIMSMTKYKKANPDDYPKELEFVSSISPKKRLDPESKEGEAEIYAVVNKIAEVFAANVATGRKVSLETVLEHFGQGGMITGDDAVAVGMADRVDTLEALLTRLDEEEARSYSSYGDPQMNRTEYKDKFPGEYEAIRAEGAVEASASLTLATNKITTLEQDNAKLQGQIDKAAEINAANDARLKALEKDKAIALEKVNQVKAESVFTDAFKASGIAPRLESKVRKTCDTPEAFTKDGVFDAEGYKVSITAEISDWAKELGATGDGDNPPLKGLGASGAEGDTGSDDAKVDAAVDSMFAILQ
jgi:ClpP class serine protease